MFDFGINCSFKFSHTVPIIPIMELHHAEHVLISTCADVITFVPSIMTHSIMQQEQRTF